MAIVVDTNVLLSAAIADSKTRELVVNMDERLVAPEAIYREIESYRGLIAEKSGLEDEEVEELLDRLFKYIEILHEDEIDGHVEEAKQELAEVDEDDVIFLAAALAIDGVIWSDDSDLQEQEVSEVYTTGEVIQEFYTDQI
ncbi:MAG: PIN domain-containing protein [Candidatus Nanohalobium sp.]